MSQPKQGVTLSKSVLSSVVTQTVGGIYPIEGFSELSSWRGKSGT